MSDAARVLVAWGALLVAAAGAPHPSASHYRSDPGTPPIAYLARGPLAPESVRRELDRVIAVAAAGRSGDERLAEVASWAAETLLEGHFPPSAGLVRWHAQALGVPDEKVFPYYIDGVGDPVALIGRLIERAAMPLPADRPVRWGMALAHTDKPQPRFAGCLLVTWGLIDVQPFSRALKAAEPLALEGRLPAGFRDPEATLVDPRGAILRAHVRRPEGLRVALQLERPAGPGVYQVELTADGPAGRTVLMNVPVFWGVAAADQPPAWITPVSATPPDTLDGATEQLVHLINETRAAERLASVAVDARLGTVAHRFAQQLAAMRAAQHIGPDGSTPDGRLAAAKIPFDRMAENVAMGATVPEVHAVLMASPAHRAAIVDPGITVVGVGIARGLSPSGTPLLYAAEEFAILNDERPMAPLRDEVMALINGARAKQHLPPLQLDARLAALANAHSAAMAASGVFAYQVPAQHAPLMEQALAIYPHAAVAADIFISGSPQTVAGSKNIVGAYTHVGVGLMRASSEKYGTGRLWITLLFAAEP